MWLGSHDITRARLTQVMNLLLLAPSLQEDVFHLAVLPGWEPITERDLRRVLQSLVWEEQIAVWRSLSDPRRSSLVFGRLWWQDALRMFR